MKYCNLLNLTVSWLLHVLLQSTTLTKQNNVHGINYIPTSFVYLTCPNINKYLQVHVLKLIVHKNIITSSSPVLLSPAHFTMNINFITIIHMQKRYLFLKCFYVYYTVSGFLTQKFSSVIKGYVLHSICVAFKSSFIVTSLIIPELFTKQSYNLFIFLLLVRLVTDTQSAWSKVLEKITNLNCSITSQIIHNKPKWTLFTQWENNKP